jgi:hypothetical protein
VCIDFVFGIILIWCLFKVPRIKKLFATVKGELYRDEYKKQALYSFVGWASLLCVSIILSFSLQFSHAIASTVHIFSVLNSCVQLINTIQFWVAFEFIFALELVYFSIESK